MGNRKCIWLSHYHDHRYLLISFSILEVPSSSITWQKGKVIHFIFVSHCTIQWNWFTCQRSSPFKYYVTLSILRPLKYRLTARYCCVKQIHIIILWGCYGSRLKLTNRTFSALKVRRCLKCKLRYQKQIVLLLVTGLSVLLPQNCGMVCHYRLGVPKTLTN